MEKEIKNFSVSISLPGAIGRESGNNNNPSEWGVWDDEIWWWGDNKHALEEKKWGRKIFFSLRHVKKWNRPQVHTHWPLCACHSRLSIAMTQNHRLEKCFCNSTDVFRVLLGQWIVNSHVVELYERHSIVDFSVLLGRFLGNSIF